MTNSQIRRANFSAWLTVALLSFAYTISILDRIAISLLVSPIKRDLALSDTEMGLLLGVAFGVFYSLMGLPMGRLVDRCNRRNLIVFAIVTWSLMTVMSGFAQNYMQLFIARMGIGIGEAVLAPAAWSMVSDLFPPERRAKPLACISIGATLGSTIGFFASAWLLDAADLDIFAAIPYVGALAPWRVVLVLAGVPGLIVAILFLSLKEPNREQTSELKGQENGARHASLSEVGAFLWTHRSSLGLVYIGAGLLVLTAYSVISWMPTVLARQYGLGASDAGYILGCLSIFSVIGVYVGGVITDRQLGAGNHRIYTTLFISSTLGILAAMTVMAGNPVIMAVLLGLGLYNVSYGLLAAPVSSFIQRLTPPNMRGLVSALYVLTVNMMGYVAGPPLVALLSDNLQADGQLLGKALVMVCALSATGAFLLFYITLKPTLRLFADRSGSAPYLRCGNSAINLEKV